MPDEILKDRETLVLPEFTVGIHRLAYICQTNREYQINPFKWNPYDMVFWWLITKIQEIQG